ncbi:MAG: hypothetical protein D8M58_00020 [Calditrichaeota bacterium]|nr:MAG: hypothetical protein DWQ03_07060 [Calditrichota bacterium]MBL1203754.1 hypothetical protein [Calditrichota bacterium]
MILSTGRTSPRGRPLIFTVIRAVGFQAALAAGFKTWVKNSFTKNHVLSNFYVLPYPKVFWFLGIFKGGKRATSFSGLPGF